MDSAASNIDIALLISLLASFSIAVLIGLRSRRLSYYLGSIGSGLGIALALLVLLTGASVDVNLWQIIQSNYFKIAVIPFNSYFLLISCFVWLGTCLYSLKYDDYPDGLASLLLLTMFSMIVIILSGDAVSFLVGWETMTIASFFMILRGKGNADIVRRAAFLFLAFGEVSTVFVMLSFSGMVSSTGSLNFLLLSPTPQPLHATALPQQQQLLPQQQSSALLGSWVFVSALIGFGLKMGIAPFHISEWLPIAHSNAPSNASAVLSATLTLMGVYGFISIVSHLGQYELWWGWVTLVIGGVSALLGALFASVSEHAKGLPAYSTIENNGLIVVAIGVYILASHYHIQLLADLAVVAALYHAFSHSISKAALFLIMGWISKVKDSFDLSSSRPLLRSAEASLYVPAIFTVFSLAAVPPLAGFVSEWLVLQSLFQSFRFEDITSQITGTIIGAIVALAAGIIIVAMTKAYGFGVLWNRANLKEGVAETADRERLTPVKTSFWYFFVLILGLGIAAPGIILLASNALSEIVKEKAFDSLVTGLLGVPNYFVILSGKPFGGFSPTFTAIFMAALIIIPFIISRASRSKWKIRRAEGWFSGSLPADSHEMYNSFGYSTPIRIMLNFLFRTKEKIVHIGAVKRPLILSPAEYIVELEVLDVFKQFYDVLTKYASALSFYVAMKVMPGRVGLYLIYILGAFIFVLFYLLFMFR
jgi:hydrogenase-4 component B